MLWIKNLPREAVIALIGIVAVILLVLVVKCSGDGGKAAQAEQGNKSSEALGDAAVEAIDLLQNRTATEATIDAAVERTTDDIRKADDVDAVRAAVIAGVCGQASHRDDPACQVRGVDP